jgi:hypothetical protein
MKNEIILYKSNEIAEHIEVRIEDDKVWLTQMQMATLFGQTKQNISLYINNCFREKELAPPSVVKDSLTTATAVIYTKNISKQLQLDLDKHNSQYPKIVIKPFANSHDRFLIIDKKELYHLGASLKDLGKKWFAFSRMDSLTADVLAKLQT